MFQDIVDGVCILFFLWAILTGVFWVKKKIEIRNQKKREKSNGNKV